MDTVKHKHRFNLFDLAVLAGLLALLLGGAWLVVRRHTGERGEAEIYYTVRIENADAALEDWSTVQVGDPVCTERGTAALGTVLAVTVEPHTVAVVKEERVVFEAVPDRVDVTVDVVGIGRVSNSEGLRLSEIRIAAGSRGAFRFGNRLASSCTVIAASVREG